MMASWSRRMTTQRLSPSSTISRKIITFSSLESRGIGINNDLCGTMRNSRNLFRPILSSLSNNHLRSTTSLHYSIESSQVRTMVMITKTKSSDEDNTMNNDVTSTTNIASSMNNSIEKAGGGIIVTTNCASRIRQLASSRPNPNSIYLRLYVDAGGCSGFQYKFLLLSEDDSGISSTSSTDDGGGGEDGTIDPEEDVVFTKDGMRVVVDQTSLDLLRGSTIDYVSEMIRSSFAVVGNPQSESACGCGSSFAVKNFGSNPALD